MFFSSSLPEKTVHESWKIKPYYLFGFAGMVFFATWLLSQFLNPLLLRGVLVFEPFGPLPYLASFAAFLLTLFITWLGSNTFTSSWGRTVLIIFAIVFGPLAALTPYLLPVWSQLFILMLWLLSGIGGAALLLLWGSLIVTLKGSRTTLFLASAVLTGALLYLFILALIETVTYLAVASLPIVSTLCFLLSYRYRQPIIEGTYLVETISSVESDDKDPLSWKLMVNSIVCSSSLGIGVYFILHEFAYPATIILGGVAIVASCSIRILDELFTHKISSKMQLKLFVLLAALCVFPLSFVTGNARYVFVFLIFLVFMFSFVAGFSSLSECVRLFELSPLRVLSYGNAYAFLGLLLGYLFAGFAFSRFVPDGIGVVLAFSALMLVYIVTSTFLRGDYYPTSNDATGGLENAASTSFASRNPWNARCEIVARRYHLSPRQTEVLHMLAKGRNISYIQEQLIISPYTAKAHVYNTYQKMGIHSRQELLNIIEQVDVDIDS
jgi:DNA-binding CsgD family transcriptional regulator